MSSHELVGLDLEDLTARQLRKLLNGAARMALLKGKRPGSKKEDDEEGDDEETSENDDLVNLHEEQKGDSKPPKVTRGDLPKGIKMPEEEDEDEIQIAKTKKKGKK